MTFTEHLEELRWCLLKSLAAIVVAAGLCYFFSDVIFAFVVAPLRQNLRRNQSSLGGGGCLFEPGSVLPDLAFCLARAVGQ
jgi:Sec-independent protein secretion pathway component TatC